MRKTLLTCHGEEIRELCPDEVLQTSRYKSGLQSIHTTAVQKTIEDQADNQVLGAPAPKINKSERELPRKTRTTPAQLCSGYSSFLSSYLFRIKARGSVTDKCPDCHEHPHTTSHLFVCPANPTHLTPRALWEQPTNVAAHLGLVTGRANAEEETEG